MKAVGGLLGFGKKEDDKDKKAAPEGAIEVPVAMSGTNHEMTVVPGPDPAIQLASEKPAEMAVKISRAIAALGEMKSDKKAQIADLQALRKQEDALKTALKDPKQEDKATAKAQDLAQAVVAYAVKYKVKDLEEVGGVYPAPNSGTYAAMNAEGAKDSLPDGKIREAHHAPQVQFAESLVDALAKAGKAVKKKAPVASAALSGAASGLEKKTKPGDLPAILVHQDTHRTHGGEGARIHGSEIREDLDKLLADRADEGHLDLSAVPTTATDLTTVKPGDAAYKRQLEKVAAGQGKSVHQALATEGPAIIDKAYRAEKERSLGAVQIAVKESKVDGPEDEKMAAVSKFRTDASEQWDGYIEDVKATLEA